MKSDKTISSSSKSWSEESDRDDYEPISASSEDEQEHEEKERELAVEPTLAELHRARADGSHYVYRKRNQEQKLKRASKKRLLEGGMKMPVSKLKEVVQASEKEERDPRFDPRCGNLDVDGPMEFSSRKPVSRFRQVIRTPKNEARDPRFDPRCGKLDVNEFRKNYSFLFEDRLPAEKEELKKQLKKTKDPKVVEELKNHLSWIEEQLNLGTTKSSDAAILSEHKKKEEAAKHGK